jgi:GH24 family phage-related lysozyme (muramidase)
MPEITGFGLDISGFNASLKQAEESFNRLKRTGVATAQAINRAFADASQGGIQQMRQNIDNMFSALSKDGGAQKSVEKIGEAMSGVGAQASKSATGIDALIRSIVNGGATYADLMQKINGTGFRSSSTKNSELVKVESQIEENKKKLAELKAYIDNFGKSDGLSEGARREAAEIKNTIDMLERKRESLMANIRLQERVASFTPKSEIAKGSSQEYVAMYDRAIKEYTQLWEQADKKVAKQKVAEYKATLNEIMDLDKSMYSTKKAGVGGTEDAKVVEARYKELMQKKLALENEIDDLIARNRLNKEDKLAKDVENIQAKSGAKTSAERQRRVALETDAEKKEKIAQYKATLAEMRSLDSKIHYVNTRGTDAEKAAMAKSIADYKQLNAEKERLEKELGRSVSRIRNQFEREVQSEAGKRAVQTRIMRENEAKKAAAEENRIEREKLKEYRSLQQQRFSLTGDIDKLGRKTGLSDADKARLDELRRREQELNRGIAALSVQLGHKKDSIDREYQNKVLQRTAKRCVQESEIETRESEKTRKQVIREYENTVSRMVSLKKQMENSSSLASSSKKPEDIASAKAAYNEQYRQYQEFDAKRQILENQFVEWLKGTRAKQTAQQLDEDINAIRKRQAEEQAAAAAKAKADSAARQQSYQSYVTSYDGAMRASNKVFARQLSENEHIKAIENLTAARKRLNESDANYKKQVEELNKAIQKHEEFLARASRTTDQNTEAARRNAEQQRRRQDQIDRSRKSPTEILATDTSNMTLRELRNFSASVKATMADLTPRSNEWNQLNGVLRNTTKQIDGIKREMGLLRGQTGATADAVANLGRFMSAAFIAQKIWSFTNAVVNLSGEFEQMHVAINVIVGSLEDANKIWEQTMALAVKSPFQAKELIKYTRQLAAYRIETSKLHDTTKMLADVSAGLGVDMSRLILAYGQVRAAEYLRGTELRQFTEAGVPMLEELSKHFTELEGRVVSTAEVFDMISKRQVNFSDVNAVLESMTSDGGPFYKMQEQMSNTIKGTISNLKDEVDLMMYEIGQSSDGWIKGTLKTLRFLVKQWEIVGAAIKIVLGLYLGYQAAALVTAFRSGAVASALAGEAVALTGVASGYVKAKLAMQAFNTAMMGTPIGLIIAGVTALLSIITLVTRKWSDNKKAQEQRAAEIEDEMNRISEAYEGMKKRVGQALEVFDDADSSARDAEVALYKLVELASDEYHLTFQVDVKGKSKEEIKQEATKIATEVLAVAEDTRSLQESWARSWETMSLSFDKYHTAVKQVGTIIQTVNGEELETAVYEPYVKKSKKDIEDELTDAQKAITDYFESVRGKIKEELTREEEQAALSMSPMEVLRMYLNKKSTSGKELDANETMVLNAIDVINEAYNKIADEILASEYLSNDKGASIQAFLGALIKDGEMTDVQVKELQTIIETKLGRSLTVTSTSLTDWQKKFNEFLATVPDASLANLDSRYVADMGDRYKKLVDGERSNDFARFFDAISPGDNVTQEALAKKVKEELDKWENIKKAYEGAMKKGVKSIYSKDDYELALKGIEFLDPVNTFLTGGEDKDKKQKAIKILNDRIELIKKMHKQYIDEYKTFGDDAEAAVAKAYKKAFKDAFEGTGIQFSGLVIDKDKLTELQKAGDEAGEAFSEAMLAKMAEVAEKGTYIRDITADAIDLLREHEDIRNKAYQDSGGVWTIGMGQTFNRKENRPVQEGDYWTDEEILMYSQEEIKSKRKDLNDILDLHRDILLTQEQYNQVFNATWQGGKGSASALFQYAKDAEAFKGWLEELDNMPIVQVLLDDEGKIKERKKVGVWDIDVDAEIKKFNELESVYERIALVMKYISVRDAANRDTTEGMIARAQGRADAFRGDLAVVHLLQKAAIDVSQVDFTNVRGVVNILKQLKPIAEKEGEEAVQALEEAIAEFEAQIGVDLKKESDEKIKDKVQKIFSNYELSLELKELNIPPDLGKSLFGAEYLTLDALKENVINQFAEGAKDGGDALKTELNKSVDKINWKSIEDALGKDQAGEVKKRLEEIDKLENKAAKERMKTYSKYLVEGMNDRVKLKIEEMRKLKEIEESPEFNPEQKEQIKKQVSKEAREEQDKQEWEAFKGTEMYTMMFDDLEHLGTKALDALQKKLEELKGSLSDLPATEVKEIVQQISKIEDMVIEKTNPFKYMRELKKELKGMKSEDEYQIQLLDATKMQEDAQKYIDAYDTAMSALMSEDEGVFEEMDSETLATWTEMLRLAEEQGKTVKEIYDIKKDDLETGKKQASEADKGLKAYKKAKKALQEQANAWGEYESQASEAFAVTKELMTTLGADTDGVAMSLVESGESLVMLTFQAIQFGIQMQIAGYQANMALGVIGWILIAVQAIVTLIAAIFSAKDKSLQKEIEGHLNEVEKLKEDYEELEALMEKAWSTEDIAYYNAEMKRTMNLAIEAQKAAIKAQESRKGANKEGSDVYEELQDMKKELEEMENTLAESLEESFSKVTDGILDEVLDAAKEFTDAWYDAFKETGDGLSGLEENFDEMFMNLAKNQAAMQITGAFTERWKEALKDYINDEDTELTKEEAAAWAAEVRSSFPELNEALEAFLGTISEGLGGKSGSLSELQKGIQGVTEETAQVLEALLNSMRLYVADTNNEIKSQTTYIKRMWQMMDNAVTGSSPFYVQMKTI